MPEDKLVELQKVFKGNLDLMLFYLTWIKNGLNASKAYKELHPNVDEHSARVLGSRQLAKINKEEIMRAYGLDKDLYFKQLFDGNLATKWNDFTGEREPDHKTRQAYHDKLGKLLGLEGDKGINIQVNNMSLEVVPDDKETKPVAV